MEGVIAGINPKARVIHLMHGLPDFDIRSGARTMETVINLPIGIHVCVVDPGVGTKRLALIIQTKRGDYLVGPDNGVLLPATNLLGGIKMVVKITNQKFMRHPVSPIFHGRDIFSPAAAHLSKGVEIKKFGPTIDPTSLVRAPYSEATIEENKIVAQVIHINKYGSLHLNILNTQWDKFSVERNNVVRLSFGNGQKLDVPFVTTFGEAKENAPLILKDDYGRVEVAINMENFSFIHKIKIGDTCIIEKI